MIDFKKAFVDTSPFIYFIEKDINKEIAKKAAQIRADYKGFKAMDALQLAVACCQSVICF